MGATDTSAVQITINVVDVNSGQVVTRVVGELGKLGTAGATAGKQLKDGLDGVGTAGADAGTKAGKGMKDIGAHALTSLDNVRLLRDDLGIHIPRSMEKAIASSKALSTIVSGIGGTLLGLGTVELGFHVGKEIYDLYDKLTDINKEVRKYEEGAARASAQHLFAAGDIETQLLNLRSINAEIGKLQTQQANAANKGFFGQLGQRMGAGASPLDYTGIGYLYRAGKTAYDVSQGNSQRDTNLAASLQIRDASKEKEFTDQQAANLARVKATLAARAEGAGAAVAPGLEQDSATRLAAMRRKQTFDLNKFQEQQFDQHVAEIQKTMKDQGKSSEDVKKEVGNLGVRPKVDPNAGMTQYGDDANAAAEMGSAKRKTVTRKENDEIAQLRDQAHAAGLQGEEKYRAQLQSTIDGYNRKVRDGEMLATSAEQMELAAREKANREYQERRRNEFAETARIQADALRVGSTGLARGDAELQGRMSAIAQESPNYADPATRGLREAAARQASLAEQQKFIDDFNAHIQQMDDSRANSSMSANQRIDTETRRTTAEIRKAWDELYGQLAAGDARRVQGQVALNAELAKINEGATQQKKQVSQQLNDETRKLQDEAGRGGGGDHYAEQYRTIENEMQEHLRKIEELKQQAGASDVETQRQYAAQEIAVREIANNKELDLARQQRDKLAGELKGFMSNPLEALKRQGEDIASKAAADLLMGHLPGQKGGAGGSGGIGGIFGTGIFRPTFGRNSGPRGVLSDGAHGGAAEAAHQAIVNATTAIINVGSASFGSGGGAAAGTGGGAGGGSYVPTGNGGFFNVGGSTSSSGASEIGSAAAHAPSAGGAPYIPSGPVGMGGDSPAEVARGIYGETQGAYSTAGAIANQAGMKGSIISKVPGLKNLSDEDLGKLGGTAGGALGVFSAFEGKGGAGGAISGALSGWQAGSAFGGIAGGVIGAAIGGVAGLIGHGARVEAQKYWFKELMPKAQQDMLGFGQGTVDYMSAYNDFESMETEAKQRTRQMGPGAVSYYNDTIKPRIDAYITRLTREQKAGRSQFGMQAAQAHQGGWLSDFGSMATSANEGWVHGKKGEIVLNEQAAMSHGDVAMMMNSGTSRSDIGDYLSGGGGATQRPVEGSGDTHLHVHTMDVKGVRDFLSSYKHDIRGAVASSYAENSGGSDYA